jgi:hypothetical protein
MKPSQVVSSLETAIQAGMAVMLYGTPGIGKSDMVRSVAEKLGYELVDIRVSQLDPVDIRGLPTVDRTDPKAPRTIWTLPSWWPRKGKKTMLFFDELNSGAQAVQAACYQIFLDRALGEEKLPDDTVIVAAGNNLTDGGVVNQMPTPLKNRILHIDVDVNDEEWCQWAIKSGIRTEVISLIRFKPTLLNEFERLNRGAQSDADKEVDKRKKRTASYKDVKAFATPRTWAFCSKVMNANPSNDIAFGLYAGTVGEGAATELMAHMKLHGKLPDFNKIVKNPDTAPVPGADEPAVLYSLVTSLASKANAENFTALLKYSDRLPKEFAVTMAKDALMRDRELGQVKGFTGWARATAGVFL